MRVTVVDPYVRSRRKDLPLLGGDGLALGQIVSRGQVCFNGRTCAIEHRAEHVLHRVQLLVCRVRLEQGAIPLAVGGVVGSVGGCNRERRQPARTSENDVH